MAKKDPLKAKQAKQKKIAIVGGVLLLGLLAFQVPRTMKMLHPKGNVTTSASTTPAATTTAGSTPLAPPSLDGSSAATAAAGTGSGTSASAGATSADGVIDASQAMPASSGQLVSFSRFKSKDPFVQQVQDCTPGAASATCTSSSGAAPAVGSSSGSGGSASGSGTNGTSTSSSGAGPGSGSGSSAALANRVTTASISVNGKAAKVSVGQTFPSADPVFVLVSLTAKEAKIAIAGGSLEGGANAVGLQRGKTVTLQNTADGTRYVLKFVSAA